MLLAQLEIVAQDWKVSRKASQKGNNSNSVRSYDIYIKIVNKGATRSNIQSIIQ